MPNGKCQLHGPLSTADRARLKPSQFALPKERKYPIVDVSHARNAKSRASQQLARGNLTAPQHAQIVKRANKVIRQCGGEPSPAKGNPVRQNNDEEHGMWSSNPGTGWWIVGGLVGAALVGTGVGIYYYRKRLPPASEMRGPKSAAEVCENYRGHTYCLYQEKSERHPELYYWAIDAGAVSQEYAKKPNARTAARALIDATVQVPLPVPIVEPDEPEATEEPEGDVAGGPVQAQFQDTTPPVVRHGVRVRVANRSIEVVNRDQWEQYAPDVIEELNPAAWDAAQILDRLYSETFPEIPGNLSELPGWEVGGQPYGNVVQLVQSFQDRINQGMVTFPENVSPTELYALAALGEIPPEYIISALDLGAPNLWELWEHPSQVGVHPVVLRYREEKLPDMTDRYWQWLVWRPGEYQLRVQNAIFNGRKSGKKQARAEAFETVENIAIAQAQVA